MFEIEAVGKPMPCVSQYAAAEWDVTEIDHSFDSPAPGRAAGEVGFQPTSVFSGRFWDAVPGYDEHGLWPTGWVPGVVPSGHRRGSFLPRNGNPATGGLIEWRVRDSTRLGSVRWNEREGGEPVGIGRLLAQLRQSLVGAAGVLGVLEFETARRSAGEGW